MLTRFSVRLVSITLIFALLSPTVALTQVKQTAYPPQQV
jgi:hypothetical protein